jgi:methyltransferase OMS1
MSTYGVRPAGQTTRCGRCRRHPLGLRVNQAVKLMSDENHELPKVSRKQAANWVAANMASLLFTGLYGHNSCGPAGAEADIRNYDSYADTYDALDGGQAASALGFPKLRQQIVARANGRVLEVGVGTGLNLEYYHTQQLTSLTAIDLSQGMLQQAQTKSRALGYPNALVSFAKANVEDLPFADGSFDCIVDTFSLCVFRNPSLALKNMYRVLKPDGRLLLVEHSRSQESPILGWYQDLTASTVATMGKGCFWNQNVPELLTEAGFYIVDMKSNLAGLILSLEAKKQ